MSGKQEKRKRKAAGIDLKTERQRAAEQTERENALMREAYARGRIMSRAEGAARLAAVSALLAAGIR